MYNPVEFMYKSDQLGRKSVRNFGIAVCAGICLGTIALAGTVNVAQNKPVTSSGTFGSSSSLLQTIDDGVFLPENTQFQTGTVWWNGAYTTDPSTTPFLTIDLGQNYTIDGAIVQADNNDSYTLQYETALGGKWQTLWNVPEQYNGGGMATRPNTNQKTQYALIPTSVRAVKFFANAGDGLYAVSEIQLYTTPAAVGNAPEPTTWALFGTGLAALLFRRLRRLASLS